jgi:3D (Asp-Asp-Asp) domain-containing protein
MMKKLLCTIITSLLLLSHAHSTYAAPKNATKIKARITYYYPESPWWSRVACPKTKTAKSGVTVAAHPDFKMGTKLFIPGLKGKVGNGSFVVQDRGSAVTRKSAARGRGYVFDIYVPRSSYTQLVKSTPAWMDVYILK